jgi:hypothetical protein
MKCIEKYMGWRRNEKKKLMGREKVLTSELWGFRIVNVRWLVR